MTSRLTSGWGVSMDVLWRRRVKTEDVVSDCHPRIDNGVRGFPRVTESVDVVVRSRHCIRLFAREPACCLAFTHYISCIFQLLAIANESFHPSSPPPLRNGDRTSAFPREAAEGYFKAFFREEHRLGIIGCERKRVSVSGVYAVHSPAPVSLNYECS